MFSLLKKKKAEIDKKTIVGFNEKAYVEANPDVQENIKKGLIESGRKHLVKSGLEEIKKGKRRFHKDFNPFDERKYLDLYQDVEAGIKEGKFKSGFDHFCKFGYAEILEGVRPWAASLEVSEGKEETTAYVVENVEEDVIEHKYQDEFKDEEEEEKKMVIDEEMKSIVASAFDNEFYLMQRPDIVERNVNPLEDYLSEGWKLGLDPNPVFNVREYLKENPKVKEAGIEPFYHWLKYGRAEGKFSTLSYFPAKELTEAEKVVKEFFDVQYYMETYPDVVKAKYNPLVHYMRTGWREGRNPRRDFNTIHYILNNLDVATMQLNPFYHYVKYAKGERYYYDEVDTVKKFLGNKIFHAMQDITFPNTISKAEKLFVIVVPEHNEMSGGIFSMFSIANVVRRLKSQYGYEVILMTRPNPGNVTYCRQKNFPNSEDVYRFEQIERCHNLKELYLHLPEYTAPDFVEKLQESTLNFLKSLEVLDINLLNQNYELMPESVELESVRELAHNLTQSVAHHSYYGQSFADKYNLPTLLLPAYTDLSAYNPSTYENKENLIIYSLDEAPHKETVLAKLSEALPDYKFVEIKGITFDEYMDLATRCKFSISFGEGFDGYVAQPIYQGGIGMTVYNEEYFPSEDFLQYENFFESEEDMIDNIVDVIKSLDADREKYTELNKALVAEWDKLYSYDDYVKQIKKLINKEFELYPGAFSDTPTVGNYKTGLSSTIAK